MIVKKISFSFISLNSFHQIRGVAAVKFLVGKKIDKKGSIFFPFGQKIILTWAKKKKLVGQTPKLMHSRYASAPNHIFFKII